MFIERYRFSCNMILRNRFPILHARKILPSCVFAIESRLLRNRELPEDIRHAAVVIRCR